MTDVSEVIIASVIKAIRTEEAERTSETWVKF
jgi:hypothetical protein